MDGNSTHTTNMKKKKKKSKPTSKRSKEPLAVGEAEDLDFNDARRLVKKQKQHAKKMAKHLAELGLDENGEPLDNYSITKYPVREWKFTLPLTHDPVALNPVVTFITIVSLWSLVIWNLSNPEGALKTMMSLRNKVSLTCTWIFQGSKAVFFFFLLFISYRYGHIHFGRKDDKPEFTTMSYFGMIFTAGSGSGLFAYLVQEPLWHQYGNFFAQAGYHSQDEIDMFAINMSVFHWGITGWTQYTFAAVAMCLAGHRFQLPMTFRSCFYPILGTYTWGWMGDIIDCTTIVVTLAGLCAMLGTTAIQIVTGLQYMGYIDEETTLQETTSIWNTTVWVLIVISTSSVISGLRGGIQFISRVGLGLGSLLTLLIFVMDDTKFLLNLQVQEVGYLLQTTLFQINLWTDAFGQLREGSGRAIDGNAADQGWMNGWTVYYQAWVITWAATFGVFIACISRGRKLREVVIMSFAAPLGYTLAWFCIWGGIGLRQSRQALELDALGTLLYNNSAHFVTNDDFCFDVPQEDIYMKDAVVFTNHLPGVTPVCQFDMDRPQEAVYNVFHSFSYPSSFGGKGFGPTLSMLFILCNAVYFISSSDAATLMSDHLASNGRKNHHWARRMFWAVTVGALTTALLSSGGMDALNAIQAASVVCGLPVTILMCYLLQSTTLMCQAAEKLEQDDEYRFPSQPEFAMPVYGGIFNSIEYALSLGKVNALRVELGMHTTTSFHAVEFLKGLVVPFTSLNQILSVAFPQSRRTNGMLTASYSVCYLGWVCLLFASMAHPGLRGLSCALFVVTGGLLATVRSSFRSQYNLRSNAIADVVASMFFWPQVLTQMRIHTVDMVTIKTKKEEACVEKRNDDESVSV